MILNVNVDLDMDVDMDLDVDMAIQNMGIHADIATQNICIYNCMQLQIWKLDTLKTAYNKNRQIEVYQFVDLFHKDHC